MFEAFRFQPFAEEEAEVVPSALHSWTRSSCREGCANNVSSSGGAGHQVACKGRSTKRTHTKPTGKKPQIL